MYELTCSNPTWYWWYLEMQCFTFQFPLQRMICLKTSWPAVRMRSKNVIKMANLCWLQFGLSLNNFRRKTGTGLHKFVKHCKSLRCWEVKQLPHYLWESSLKIFLRQTFDLLASGLPSRNFTGAFSQILRELFYLPTPSTFTVFIPHDFCIQIQVYSAKCQVASEGPFKESEWPNQETSVKDMLNIFYNFESRKPFLHRLLVAIVGA